MGLCVVLRYGLNSGETLKNFKLGSDKFWFVIYRVLWGQLAVGGGLDESSNQRTGCTCEVYASWLNSKTFQKRKSWSCSTRLVLTVPIVPFLLSAQRKQAFHMRKGRIMSVGKSTSMAEMRSGHSAFLPAELLDGNLSRGQSTFQILVSWACGRDCT